MAAPNIVNVTSIIGITTMGPLTATSTRLLINNSGSNTVLRVNSIQIANTNGVSNVDVSIGINDSAAGTGTTSYLAKTVTIPADSSLVISGKDTPFYLEENRSITGVANASDADFVISYEVISWFFVKHKGRYSNGI